MFTSILTSVEYEAYTRNLSYWDYLQLHKQFDIQSTPVPAELYDALCATFDDCEIQ